MSLSKKQIDYLLDFVKKHYVEWYDLQIEMVDHLANDIEQIMKDNPGISFEEALNRAFKKFGPMGFMEIAEKKQTAIRKKYFINILKEFKSLVSSYQFLYFVFSTIIISFLLIYSPYKKNIILFFLILLLIIPLYFFIKYRKKISYKKKKGEKIYLVETSILQSIALMYTLFTFNFIVHTHLPILKKLATQKLPPFFYFLYAFVIVFILFWYYFGFIKVPKKMIQKTKEQYEKLLAQAH